MTWPNENPLTPDSLAADGIQGADANARRAGEAKHNPEAACAVILARVAMDAAQTQLQRYALATDDPEPGIPEAAYLLDAALAAMDGAP